MTTESERIEFVANTVLSLATARERLDLIIHYSRLYYGNPYILRKYPRLVRECHWYEQIGQFADPDEPYFKPQEPLL